MANCVPLNNADGAGAIGFEDQEFGFRRIHRRGNDVEEISGYQGWQHDKERQASHQKDQFAAPPPSDIALDFLNFAVAPLGRAQVGRGEGGLCHGHGLGQLHCAARSRCIIRMSLVLRHHKFKHVGALEGINAFFAQQAHGVKIRGGGQIVLLRHPARHAQLTPCQPFFADEVDICLKTGFARRTHLT